MTGISELRTQLNLCQFTVFLFYLKFCSKSVGIVIPEIVAVLTKIKETEVRMRHLNVPLNFQREQP